MRPLYWLGALATIVVAEDGLDGWLRYARLPKEHTRHLGSFPDSIVTLNATKNGPIETAGKELQTGINGILGLDLEINPESDKGSSKIIVSTIEAYGEEHDEIPELQDLIEDGFFLSTEDDDYLIIGENERGALYGAFELLSMLAQADFSKVAYSTNPDAPIRWANQWDNLWDNGTHGSIERGNFQPHCSYE